MKHFFILVRYMLKFHPVIFGLNSLLWLIISFTPFVLSTFLSWSYINLQAQQVEPYYLFVVLYMITSFLYTYLLRRGGFYDTLVNFAVRQQIFEEHLLQYDGQNSIGTVMNMVQSDHTIMKKLLSLGIDVVVNGLTIFVLFCLLFFLDWRLTIAGLLPLTIAVWIGMAMKPRLTRQFERVRRFSVGVSDFFYQSLQLKQTVSSLVDTQAYETVLRQKSRRYNRAFVRYELQSAAVLYTRDVMINIALLAIIATALLLAKFSFIDFKNVMLCLGYFKILLVSTDIINELNIFMSQADNTEQRIQQFFRKENMVDRKQQPTTLLYHQIRSMQQGTMIKVSKEDEQLQGVLTYFMSDQTTERVGYVEASPVFLNDTLSSNVSLYGRDTVDESLLYHILGEMKGWTHGEQYYTTAEDNLSVGQKIRLSFVRAVHQSDRYIFMENIFLHLDEANRQIIGEYMKQSPYCYVMLE